MSNARTGSNYTGRCTDQFNIQMKIGQMLSDMFKISDSDKELEADSLAYARFFDIKIKDNSVFYVNVIIRSRLSREELNPTLKDPKGNSVKLDGQENIKLSS